MRSMYIHQFKIRINHHTVTAITFHHFCTSAQWVTVTTQKHVGRPNKPRIIPFMVVVEYRFDGMYVMGIFRFLLAVSTSVNNGLVGSR